MLPDEIATIVPSLAKETESVVKSVNVRVAVLIMFLSFYVRELVNFEFRLLTQVFQ